MVPHLKSDCNLNLFPYLDIFGGSQLKNTLDIVQNQRGAGDKYQVCYRLTGVGARDATPSKKETILLDLDIFESITLFSIHRESHKSYNRQHHRWDR